MIDINKLRGIIAERNVSQADVAKEIGITPKTFYGKMAKGVFLSSEMDSMVEYLNIENPLEIFFTHRVT